MKKALKITLITLGVIAIIIVGIITATGFMPGLSSLFGTNQPKDLGVKYTEADYQSAIQKLGQKIDTSAGFGPDTKMQYSTTTKKVDATFSNEEVSALLSMNHADKYPIKKAQVKANPDGTLEASAKVKFKDYKGYSFDNSVYIKGEVAVTNNQPNIQADELEIGRVSVPITPDYIDTAESEARGRIMMIPGLNLESVSVTEDGQIHVKGTVPESAKRVPR